MAQKAPTPKELAELNTKIWNIVRDVNGKKSYDAERKVSKYIGKGVDVFVHDPKGDKRSLYQVAVDAREANRMAKRADKENHCNGVIRRLQEAASARFRAAVIANNMDEVQRIHQGNYGADLHQAANGGPFGLLGDAVRQPGMKLVLVQFLIANSPQNSAAVESEEKGAALHAIAAASGNGDLAQYLKRELGVRLLALARQDKSPAGAQRAKQLVDRGADIEMQDDQGNTPLCVAAASNNTKVIEYLISAGCNLSHQNRAKQNAFSIASSNVVVDNQLVNDLRIKFLNVDMKSTIEEKKSDLQTEDLHELLKQNANINYAYTGGDTPLHMIIANHVSAQVVDDFITKLKANIEAANDKGLRPLDLAILTDDSLELVQRLLDLKADIVRPKQGLIAFARANGRDATAVLLQNWINEELWNTVQTAPGAIDALKRLHGCGANLTFQHSDAEHKEWSIIHLAAAKSDLTVLRWLVSLNLDFNVRNGDGHSPLMVATVEGKTDVLEYLVALGANLQIAGTQGETALHIAVEKANEAHISFLVKKGSNVGVTNASNQTPGQLAQASGKPELVSFFNSLAFPGDLEDVEAINKDASVPAISVAEDVTIISCPVGVRALRDYNNDQVDPRGNVKPTGLLATFADTPNDRLAKVACNGTVDELKAAYADGADLRYRSTKEFTTALQQAIKAEASHQRSANSSNDPKTIRSHRDAANRIQGNIRCLVSFANDPVKDAVIKGNPEDVKSYHTLSGATLDDIVLPLLASNSPHPDAPEVLQYLIANSNSLANYVRDNCGSLLANARNMLNQRLIAFLVMLLSQRLATAVQANNLNEVQRLHSAGASVEYEEKGVDYNGPSSNLSAAVRLGNFMMVKFLVEKGSRLTGLPAPTGAAAADTARYLRQKQLDQQLRLAAGKGNLAEVIKVHHQGADIEGRNCHGSTPLLMSVLHGEYMQVVHYLVSRGAAVIHDNPQLKALLPLSKQFGYRVMPEYFIRVAGTQFLRTVMANDFGLVKRMEQLVSDFNAVDDQGRNCVHLAAAYGSKDLLQWLSERGARFDLAATSGELPLHAAVKRGDYAIVEFVLNKNPALKELADGEGRTALDIAKQHSYEAIVKFLGGDSAQDQSGESGKLGYQPPKYTLAALIKAVELAQMPIVNEFIAERYSSLKEKTDVCTKLLAAAAAANQKEVENKLRKYHDNLASELDSEQTANRLLQGTQAQQQLLTGFLNGLSTFLCGGDVKLDPNDPATFQQFFAQSAKKADAAVAKVSGLRSVDELKSLQQSDLQALTKQIQVLQKTVHDMQSSKTELEKKMQIYNAQLTNAVSAMDKKKWFKELQTVKDQMNLLQSQQEIAAKAREVQEKRAEVQKRFQADPLLSLYFRTFNTTLEAFFVGCKAGSTEMFAIQNSQAANMKMAAVDVLSGAISMMPLVGSAVSTVLSKAGNAYVKGKDDARNASMVKTVTEIGTMAELQQLALNVAARATLYYSEQIRCLVEEPPKKEKADSKSATDANKSGWITAPQILARYAIKWIVKSFVENQISSLKPLDDQLFFAIVSRNPYAKNKSLDDKLESLAAIANKPKLWFRSQRSGEIKQVELKAVYGRVGVVDVEDGQVYGTADDVAMFGTCVGSRQIALLRGLPKLHVGPAPDQQILRDFALFSSHEGAESIGSAGAGSGGSIGSKALSAPVVTVEDQVKAVLEKLNLTRDSLLQSVSGKREDWQAELEEQVTTLSKDLETKTAMFQTSVDAVDERVAKSVDEVNTLAAEHLKKLQAVVDAGNSAQKSEFKQFTNTLTQENNARRTEQNKQVQDMVASHKKAVADLSADFQARVDKATAELKASFEALKTEFSGWHQKFFDEARAKVQTTMDAATARLEQMHQANQEALLKQSQQLQDEAKKAADAVIALGKQSEAAAKAAATAAASAEKKCQEVEIKSAATVAAADKRTAETTATLEAQKEKMTATITELKDKAAKSAADSKLSSENASNSQKAAKESASLAEKCTKEAKEASKELEKRTEQAVREANQLLKRAEDAEKRAREAEEQSKKCVQRMEALETKVKKMFEKNKTTFDD